MSVPIPVHQGWFELAEFHPDQPQVVAAWWLPGRIPWPGWVRGGLGFLGDRETQDDPSLSGETHLPDTQSCSLLVSLNYEFLPWTVFRRRISGMDHPSIFWGISVDMATVEMFGLEATERKVIGPWWEPQLPRLPSRTVKSAGNGFFLSINCKETVVSHRVSLKQTHSTNSVVPIWSSSRRVSLQPSGTTCCCFRGAQNLPISRGVMAVWQQCNWVLTKWRDPADTLGSQTWQWENLWTGLKNGKILYKKIGFSIAIFDYQRVFWDNRGSFKTITSICCKHMHICTWESNNQGISRLNIWSLHFCIIVASWVPFGNP